MLCKDSIFGQAGSAGANFAHVADPPERRFAWSGLQISTHAQITEQNSFILRAVENDTFSGRIVTRSVSEGLGFAALADASG